LRKIVEIHYTATVKRMLVVLTTSFLLLSFHLTVLSAMDPVEIREIHENAPYHLIGVVTEDKLIQHISTSKNSPSQLRSMTLEVLELNRAATHETLRTIEVQYTYIPPWVEREGGKGMDIAVGDIIEVWLVDGEFGIEPAIGGDSIEHIVYVEERPTHYSEPISSRALHLAGSFLRNPHTSGNIVVISGIAAIFSLIAFFGLRRVKQLN